MKAFFTILTDVRGTSKEAIADFSAFYSLYVWWFRQLVGVHLGQTPTKTTNILSYVLTEHQDLSQVQLRRKIEMGAKVARLTFVLECK